MDPPFDWTIRGATPEDASAIAALIRGCWPHDTPDRARIARLIAGGRRTLCAWLGGECAGFVDAFATLDPFGQSRWEVDLLAVDLSARGRGIGMALVAASVQAAPSGVHLARGLVRVGNTPAEKSFAAAGFRPEPGPRTLFVASPQPTAVSAANFHAITVHTLTYSGLWLESRHSEETLLAARGRAAALRLEQVGTFALDEAGAADCLVAGYEAAGEFRWWVRLL